jgi:prepilin-type N-terminal cleavage/methylation domain-containing protein
MQGTDRRGFTLIELLAVVTIIGVLASIALPRYMLIRERAMVSAMTSDLRNLLTAQESFMSSYGDYAGSITAGPEIPGTGGGGSASLLPSVNVSITVTYLGGGTSEGWNATAIHSGVTDPTRDECGIYMGPPANSPNAAVTQAGVVGCW